MSDLIFALLTFPLAWFMGRFVGWLSWRAVFGKEAPFNWRIFVPTRAYRNWVANRLR